MNVIRLSMLTSKRQMNINGVVWLSVFSFLLACNQVVIKIALCARATRISEKLAETVLFAQLLASGPLLLITAMFFGPFIREIDIFDGLGLLFQVFVASYGFLVWFRLIAVYEGASVASFSFLSPVLSVFLGWLILPEYAG